jgi:hypothetical protein
MNLNGPRGHDLHLIGYETKGQTCNIRATTGELNKEYVVEWSPCESASIYGGRLGAVLNSLEATDDEIPVEYGSILNNNEIIVFEGDFSISLLIFRDGEIVEYSVAD